MILNITSPIFCDKMKVSELKANKNVDEIVLKIVEKKEPREVFRRYGGTAKVCDLIGEDDEGGRVQITLWNDEIDMVEENDIIKITDGWVKEWNNQLQISTGRSGKIEKI
ncbi:MAG: DNA-binding protein [Thermoplasmata archaeon]|nr:DNA-binding protein [Thermoplasmata archaeon]